ncbi:MAG: spore maturation protein [Clostridiales bacterium]|nr:spore maturation protein [Clostridiales bacterium]
MKYLSLLIPLLFIAVLLYAAVKKVKLYDSFTAGIKGAIPLIVSIFPYLAAILMLSELFEQSGLSAILTGTLSPVFDFFGIPPELSKLVLIKPFSGSGATALLSEILSAYGADSYIGRCACVCYGSSETVFYISAVYFAGVKYKKLALPVCIALAANFLTVVFGCLICRVL